MCVSVLMCMFVRGLRERLGLVLFLLCVLGRGFVYVFLCLFLCVEGEGDEGGRLGLIMTLFLFVCLHVCVGVGEGFVCVCVQHIIS